MPDLNHQTERAYISDKETWSIFIGDGLNPVEFIKHYSNIHDAIDDFVADYPWSEPCPSWLEDSLRNYILAYLA